MTFIRTTPVRIVPFVPFVVGLLMVSSCGRSAFGTIIHADAAIVNVDGDATLPRTIYVYPGYNTTHDIETSAALPSLAVYTSTTSGPSQVVNCDEGSGSLVPLGVSLSSGGNAAVTFTSSSLLWGGLPAATTTTTSYPICSGTTQVSNLFIVFTSAPALDSTKVPSSRSIVVHVPPSTTSSMYSWRGSIPVSTSAALRSTIANVFLVSSVASATCAPSASLATLTVTSTTEVQISGSNLHAIYSADNTLRSVKLCVDGSPVLNFVFFLAIGSTQSVVSPVATSTASVPSWTATSFTVPSTVAHATTASSQFTLSIRSTISLAATTDITSAEFGSSVALCDATGTVQGSTSTVTVSESATWTTSQLTSTITYSAASSNTNTAELYLCWKQSSFLGSAFTLRTELGIQFATLTAIGAVTQAPFALQPLAASSSSSSTFHWSLSTLSSTTMTGTLFLGTDSTCGTQAGGSSSAALNSTKILSTPQDWMSSTTTTTTSSSTGTGYSLCYTQSNSAATFPFFGATFQPGGVISGFYKATDTVQETPALTIFKGGGSVETALKLPTGASALPFDISIGYVSGSSSSSSCVTLKTLAAGSTSLTIPTTSLADTGTLCASTATTSSLALLAYRLMYPTTTFVSGLAVFPGATSFTLAWSGFTPASAAGEQPTVKLCGTMTTNSEITVALSSDALSLTVGTTVASPAASNLDICLVYGGTTSAPLLSSLNTLPFPSYTASAPTALLGGFTNSEGYAVSFQSSLAGLGSTMSESMTITFVNASDPCAISGSASVVASGLSVITLTNAITFSVSTTAPTQSLPSGDYKVCGKVASSAVIQVTQIVVATLSIEGTQLPVPASTNLVQLPVFSDTASLSVASTLSSATTTSAPSTGVGNTQQVHFFVDATDCTLATAVHVGTLPLTGGSLSLAQVSFIPDAATGIYSPYEVCVALGTSGPKSDSKIRLSVVDLRLVDNQKTALVTILSSSPSWVTWLSSTTRAISLSGSGFDSLTIAPDMEFHSSSAASCSTSTPDFVASITASSATSASFPTPTTTGRGFEVVCLSIVLAGSTTPAKTLLDTRMRVLHIVGFLPLRTDGVQQQSLVALRGTIRSKTLSLDSSTPLTGGFTFGFYLNRNCSGLTNLTADGLTTSSSTDMTLDVNKTDPGRYSVCITETATGIIGSTGVTLTVAHVTIGGNTLGDQGVIGSTVNEVLDLQVYGQFLIDIRLYFSVTDLSCSSGVTGQTYVGNTRSPVLLSGCSATLATVPLPAATSRTTPGKNMNICYFLLPSADPEPLNLATMTFQSAGLYLAVTVPSDVVILREISDQPDVNGEFRQQPKVAFQDGDSGAILGSIPVGTVVKAEWLTINPVSSEVGEGYDLTSNGGRTFDWTNNPVQLRNFKYGFTYVLRFRLLSASRVQPKNSTIVVQPQLCADLSNYGKFGTSQCAPCNDKLVCDGTVNTYVKGHYWRHNNRSEALYSCEPPYMVNTCDRSTETGTCVEGHTGPRCSVCEPGYSFAQKFCSKCPEQGVVSWIFVILILAVLLLGISVLVNSTMKCAKADQFPMFLKITVNHFVISSMIGEFYQHVPSSMLAIVQAQRTVSRPSPQSAWLSCATNLSWYDLFLVVHLLPLVLMLVIGTVVTLAKSRQKKMLLPGEEDDEAEGEKESDATKVTIVELEKKTGDLSSNPLVGQTTTTVEDFDAQSDDDDDADDESGSEYEDDDDEDDDGEGFEGESSSMARNEGTASKPTTDNDSQQQEPHGDDDVEDGEPVPQAPPPATNATPEPPTVVNKDVAEPSGTPPKTPEAVPETPEKEPDPEEPGATEEKKDRTTEESEALVAEKNKPDGEASSSLPPPAATPPPKVLPVTDADEDGLDEINLETTPTADAAGADNNILTNGENDADGVEHGEVDSPGPLKHNSPQQPPGSPGQAVASNKLFEEGPEENLGVGVGAEGGGAEQQASTSDNNHKTNVTFQGEDSNNASFNNSKRKDGKRKSRQQNSCETSVLIGDHALAVVSRDGDEPLAVDDTEPDTFDISRQSKFHIFAVTSIVILFLMYPPVVETAFSGLKCDSIDETEVLNDGTVTGGIVEYFFYDRRHKCTETRHKTYQILGIILGLLWGLGTPIIALTLFQRLRRPAEKGGIGKANASRLFTFLVAGYRKNVWWWEGSIMMRKFAMIFVLDFVPTPALQTLAASWVVVVSLVVHIVVSPFDNGPADTLERSSLMCLAFTLNLGLLLDLLASFNLTTTDSTEAEVVRWIVFAVNLGIVIVLIGRILLEFVQKLRKTVHDEREKILAKAPKMEGCVRKFELRPKVRYVYDKKGRAIRASELTAEERDALGIDMYEDEPEDWSDTDSNATTEPEIDPETGEAVAPDDRGFNVADLVTYDPSAISSVGGSIAEAIQEQEKMVTRLEEQVKHMKEQEEIQEKLKAKLNAKLSVYGKFTKTRASHDLELVQGLLGCTPVVGSAQRLANVEKKRRIFTDEEELAIQLQAIDGVVQEKQSRIVLPEDDETTKQPKKKAKKKKKQIQVAKKGADGRWISDKS